MYLFLVCLENKNFAFMTIFRQWHLGYSYLNEKFVLQSRSRRGFPSSGGVEMRLTLLGLKLVFSSAISLFLASGASFAEVVRLNIPENTLRFAPDRAGISVGEVWIRMQCHKSGSDFSPCENFKVSGTETNQGHAYLKFNGSEKNTVKLPGFAVEFSGNDEAFVCLAVRAIFDEITPNEDSDVYLFRGDRYSLVSICMNQQGEMEGPPENMPGAHPFRQNSSRFIEDFIKVLSNRIEIKTSTRWEP